MDLNYKHVTKPLPETMIWRYMDFTKFIGLLQYQALFFPVVKTLEDKFDGSMAGSMIVVDIALEGNSNHPSLMQWENAPLASRSVNVVSCWHMNEGESAAMWSQYSNRNAGIAIRSTVGSLEASIDFSDYQNIVLGEVNYYRFEPKQGEEFSNNVHFFHKRKSFEHEREFRVLMSPRPDSPKFAEMQQQGGLLVKVDLTKLVNAIFIAPFTLSWFEQLIKAIVNQKYNLNIPVYRSKIDSDPYIG